MVHLLQASQLRQVDNVEKMKQVSSVSFVLEQNFSKKSIVSRLVQRIKLRRRITYHHQHLNADIFICALVFSIVERQSQSDLQAPKPSSSGNQPHGVNLNFRFANVSALGVHPSDSLETTRPMAASSRRSRSML